MYSSWLSTILCLNGVMRNQVTLDCITMLPGSCTLSEGHRAAAGSTASCLLSASKEKVLKYICFHLWEWLWAPEPLGFVVSLHDPGELSSNELMPSMPTTFMSTRFTVFKGKISIIFISTQDLFRTCMLNLLWNQDCRVLKGTVGRSSVLDIFGYKYSP